MTETIYGSIWYKENSYPFFLEGRRAIIVGEAFKYYEVFQDADEEESIFGVTSDNRQILFLQCKFGRSLFQQWFSSIGYILSRGNTGETYDFTFDRISFYSEAINSFYPPQMAMKTDFDLNNWNGRMTIELRPFEDTAVSFKYEDCKCNLNITRYVNAQNGKSEIGNINSAFDFEFNSVQHYNNFSRYWLALFDFLSFVNYGRDINFEKIYLFKKMENGKYERCATVKIFSDGREYIYRPQIHAITTEDIPLNNLGSVFSKIASLRENDKRFSYYFSKNYKEEFRIDATQWLIKAMTFEGLFKKCYPDFKQNAKEQFRNAKSVALKKLNEIDQSQMSRAERKYFGDCQKQIERYEGILEEMLNYIVKKYKWEFEDIISYNLRNYSVDFGEYGEIYSNYRNRLAHGDIESVGDKEVAVFKILQAAIYFLLLEGTGLDSNALRGIVKKLFL